MSSENLNPTEGLRDDVAQENAGAGIADVRQIYETEAPRLQRYFQRRLRSREDAGDLVQESFARLVGCMARTTLPRPAAYLQRIARNLLLDRYKRLETRLLAFHVPIDDGFEVAVAPDQAARIEVEDVMRIYRQALEELPQRTQEIFLAHRVDELTYREIAENMGLSIPTVQYHVARALAHIDAALEQE
jgi:RNA polymerase sigma factor (sigma-70 family)